MRALIVLTQSECKRLIAKGLKKHYLVEDALKDGKIFIARGSTNAYIVEELIGEKIDKSHYVAGQVTGNKDLYRLGGLPASKRLKEIIIEKGVKKEITSLAEELENFGPNDLIIKGANVLDINGIPGVYMSHSKAGTIGNIIPIAISRGIPIIVPVSLAKLSLTSVWELSQVLGNKTFDKKYVMGEPIGIMPIPGEVFTEIEALELLFPNVEAYHMGSGGVGKAEGSLHFYLEGDEEEIAKAYDTIVQIIKEEEEYKPDLTRD